MTDQSKTVYFVAEKDTHAISVIKKICAARHGDIVILTKAEMKSLKRIQKYTIPPKVAP